MKLDFVLVDNSELSFNVQKEVIIIGRSPKCDIVIPHEGMSRRHCQITYKGGDLFIEDLGSVNGVYIDGSKIMPNTPTKFQTFLSVAFGAVQTLKIELDDVTKATTLPGPIAGKASTNVSAGTSPKLVHQERTGKIKKAGHAAESSGPKKVAKEEKKSNSMMIILILVAVVGVAAYFFMGQEEVPAGPTPEQIYE